VYVPYQVVLDVFVLDVSLDDDGKIQEIDGLKDPDRCCQQIRAPVEIPAGAYRE
jgi:hypothetical protein